MLILTLVVNLIAMISSGISTGLSFITGRTSTGVAMILLFLMNMMLFVINLGRLF